MHLLEAWTTLGPLHLARLLALPGAMLVATLLPGRVLARGAALVGAAAVLLLGEMTVSLWIRGAWVLAWLAIAWQAGMPDAPDLPPSPARRRGFEAGAVALLEKAHGVSSGGEILDRVLKREAMMSTGIGNGIAIPHGKARAVNRMVAACGVSPEGVDFQSVDGEPATLFVLLAAPESVGSLQVKVLANISRVLKEEGVRQSLREAAAPEEFLAALRAAEAVHIPS